jgi:hypothetical protein
MVDGTNVTTRSCGAAGIPVDRRHSKGDVLDEPLTPPKGEYATPIPVSCRKLDLEPGMQGFGS